MTQIDIAITREFETAADADTVWALLADTRRTLSHYPKLNNLVDLGDDQWRWEFEQIGIKGFSHQVIYSVRYGFNRDAGVITWTPLDAEQDNAHIAGRFDITDGSSATKVILSTEGHMHAPVPKMLSGPAKPLIQSEFNQQIETFMANLHDELGG